MAMLKNCKEYHEVTGCLLNFQFYSSCSFVLLSAARGYMCESMAGGSVAVPLMQCPCQLEQEVGMYLGSWR